MRRSDRSLEDKTDIANILKDGKIIHIAFQDKTEPYIVTLNYGFDFIDDNLTFYFHSANEGRKLNIIKYNPLVCFSISICDPFVSGEKACNYGMKYRSIVGYGTLNILSDENDRIYALNKLMENYTGKSRWEYDVTIFNKTTVTRLDVDTFSAKMKK